MTPTWPEYPRELGVARGRSQGRGRIGGESGSVTVIAAGVMVILAVMSLATADVARALSLASRAQAAADAAALAAAQEMVEPTGAEPADVAATYATRNGATLVSCECPGGGGEATVSVQVEVSGLLLLPSGRTITATARAVLDLPGVAAGGDRAGGSGHRRMAAEHGPKVGGARGEVTSRMAAP